MNRFYRFIKSLRPDDTLQLVRAAELHKLETAARVIRQMLHTGEYDGVFMCCTISKSTTLTNEEKELTRQVISHDLINGRGTLFCYHSDLSGFEYLDSRRPLADDHTFYRDIHCNGDKDVIRILHSHWYYQACRKLDLRIMHLKWSLAK